PPARSPLFPYTTLFRSGHLPHAGVAEPDHTEGVALAHPPVAVQLAVRPVFGHDTTSSRWGKNCRVGLDGDEVRGWPGSASCQGGRRRARKTGCDFHEDPHPVFT